MKKTIYISLILLLIFSNCSKDFIEIPPKDFLNSEQFYKTKDDFNSAVLAAYSKLQGQIDIYFEMVEYRSDDLDLGAPTSGTQDRFNINKFQETSANGIIRDAWDNFYNGIFRCNVITDNIKNAEIEPSLKLQFEAEARFIRGITYFNIVRYWGDAPIVLKEITAEESLKVGRSPAQDVYSEIEDDLKFAMSNLPESYPASDAGRATSGAAKAFLAKVYLAEGKFSESVSILQGLIGNYQLLENVNDIFDPQKKNNKEIIFAIKYDKEVLNEGHGPWFAISDISTSPITTKLNESYSDLDTRKSLITYQPIGNLLVPGKFLDTESASTNQYGNDYILMRYADVVLMLSEALNEQGYQSSGQAFDLLNMVRERAGLAPLTSTQLSDQNSFRTAILNERFLEFPLEGIRWFDLKRTNTAAQELESLNISIENYQLLYPVPQTELEKINNTDLFYQNEGY